MVQVLVVIHLLIAIVMIAMILLQKSEGGAAGAGFSATASVSSMNQPRARPNPLSRATTFLGICFFATSIGLALVAKPRDVASSMFTPKVEGPAVPKIDDSAVPSADTKSESSAPAGPAVPNN